MVAPRAFAELFLRTRIRQGGVLFAEDFQPFRYRRRTAAPLVGFVDPLRVLLRPGWAAEQIENLWTF